MTRHLTIGGSTASRTINCPAWIDRAKDVPKPKSGHAADKGNLLHDAMEEYYKGAEFKDLVGKLKFADLTLSDDDVTDMLLPAQKAMDDLLDKFCVEELMVEPFVQYEADEIGGSIDVLGISKDRKTVVVADYKFGSRYVPTTTEQLPFYGLCARKDPVTAWMFKKAKWVVFAIIQPALNDEARHITHPISILDDFEAELVNAINNKTKSAMGSHCKYCPASPVCPDKIREAKSAVILSPKTAEEIAQAIELADQLDDWIKQVRQQAYDIAMDGGLIPRHKLVSGRSTRKWNTNAETVLTEKLGDAAFDHKLIGITKAEKLLGKGVLDTLDITDMSEAKPNLVSEDASGDPINIKEQENLIKLVDKSLNK